MKRIRTQLEERLIEKGWKLIHKTYVGKSSDKIESYVYEKTYSVDVESTPSGYIIDKDVARVVLDNKREKVVDIKFLFQGSYINKIAIFVLKNKLALITSEVNSCLDTKENDLTIEQEVQIAESIGEANE